MFGGWAGTYMTMIILGCAQYDILFASLKNIGESTGGKDEKNIFAFRLLKN